ncbi:flagellar protein FlaG [Paenibacillus endophyticus]|uniref:Flagellar protein FlaG n=1 Tax=Paenibacillus endophyticus TaxID=1294268 RepID=A0A7W5CBH0_9BACL|nr:flagellar protein FlaG [Paenibacillus endophyticus]MBB3154633.1 flagellar protein FlaG [Paenibacillus endophyticus]
MMNISSAHTTAGYLTDKKMSSGPEKEAAVVNAVPNNGRLSVNEQKISALNGEDSHLKRSMKLLIEAVQGPDRTIERSVHEATNHIVYKVKDKESGEVIREIPEEKLLDAAALLMELTGILIDERV